MKGKTHGRAVEHFRITEDEKWRLVSAADLLTISGIGRGYVNKLRLWLAHRNINLRNDNAPSYWLEALQKPAEEAVGVCPFTIIVDTNESLPWYFSSIDDKQGNPISVETERAALWVQGLGDYTIKGMEEEIQIERKSLEDLVGTIGSRRDKFEEEIARLDSLCSFAAIVCESTWAEILKDTHDFGARAKSVMSTMESWVVRYPSVHWVMCAGRNHAETTAFRLMHNFWWQAQREETKRSLMAASDDLFSPV